MAAKHSAHEAIPEHGGKVRRAAERFADRVTDACDEISHAFHEVGLHRLGDAFSPQVHHT